MKICIIGLGSIGKRHLTNIDTILKQRQIPYQIDALRSQKKSLQTELSHLITTEYYNIEDLPNDYDIIFITNPTNLHYQTIMSCKKKATYFFIEKPLFHDLYTSIDILFEDIDTNNIYIACPLRYNPVIKYLKEQITQNTDNHIYSARVISSSYLPDWRPNIDYRNVYSSHIEQGGGVSLDLIHEWDYIVYLFGLPTHIHNFSGKYSNLEITSDDLSIYIGQYKDKLVEVHLDYFGRKSTRNIELYTSETTIYCDLINRTITYSNTELEPITFNSTDMYIDELNYFFDIVLNNVSNHNDMNHSYEILKIALGGK